MEYPRSVYAIQHNVTKKIYIGSTKNVESRFVQHLACLKANKHLIEDMQADFNEYGEDFTVFILDEIKNHQEKSKEYEWMDKYNSFERGIGYNYKDQARVKRVLERKRKNTIVKGMPNTEINVTKERLHEMIDSLSSDEVLRVYAFMKEWL